MLEALQNPLAYFATMVVVLSAASLPLEPPTLIAAKVNPAWLVATLGAVAGALAAPVDYHLVRRVFRIQTLARVRAHPLFERAERWSKVAPFLTVVAFAALPVPFFIVRVLVPLSGYPLARYTAAVALGRWPRIFVLAAFGRVLDIPPWILEVAFAASIVGVGGAFLLRRLGWIGPKDRPPAG